jgi:ABC-type sulfate/molybdate transport systems ATPase subunit
MTVRDQLGFGLRIRRAARAMVDERVRELAELLGVERLLDRSPRGLSGGEIQRVALGRALSFRPRTLLLDEPLSALDESTREELAGLLRRVQTAAGATVLHVTHNREDARLLADLILRLEEGCIRTECGPGAEQLGVPDRLKPAR